MVNDPIPYWGETTVHAGGRAFLTKRRQSGLRPFGTLLIFGVALVLVVAFREVARNVGPEQVASQADCHIESCSGVPGVNGSDITRNDVAARARQWVGNTDIRYSMVGGYAGPGGWGWYRRDCSGFVSMALRLPDADGGPSTLSLTNSLIAIPARRMRPYDIIGRLGPHSGGENGHVQLFLGWVDAKHTKVRVVEQGGLHNPPIWPHEAVYSWPERMDDGTVLRTFRYVRIRD